MAQADAVCEKWDLVRMTKKDDARESALWNSRMYTAPRLLDDPDVYYQSGGRSVSLHVGSSGSPGVIVGRIVPIGQGGQLVRCV